MGWRGTVRSIGAALRAAEREAERRHTAALKEQVAADSAHAVQAWENHLDRLVSVHANLADAIDWRAMATKGPPTPPVPSSRHTEAANTALASFRPSMFDFARGGTARIRQRLEADVADAISSDLIIDDDTQRKHTADLADWEADTVLARRLLDGDVEAIKTVLEEMNSAMTAESLVGTSIDFGIERGFLHARPDIHGIDVVPDFRRKQLASGKLSETKMPDGQRYELYQDYVSSVALKVAGDLFHLLPLPEVYVTCNASMVNPQTGHVAPTPILSVQFVRETFARLNLANIDPSDSMRNFRHAVSFKKAQGFAPIEPLARTG